MQLKLYNDDGSLLWSGPRKTSTSLVAWKGDGDWMPQVLADIDGDASIELIMSGSPHEPESPGFSIFRWDGQKFIKVQDNIDLVWVDAPYGNTLKWEKLPSTYPRQRKKRWWAHSIEQMDNESSIVSIEGVEYPS